MKEIPNSNGYKIDKLGNVYKPNGQRVNSDYNSEGYQRVYVPNYGNTNVHRLLAIVYIPNTLGCDIELLHVNHIDCNTSNNSLSNLEWVTVQQNIQHSELFDKRKGRTKLLGSNTVSKDEMLFTNIFEAEDKVKISRFDIWQSIKNNVPVNNWHFTYFKRNERIPINLHKPGFIKGDVLANKSVKVLNIATKEVMKFETMTSAANYFGTKANHIFITMSSSDTLRLFKRKYVIVPTDTEFPEIKPERVEAALSSTGKLLVSYNKDSKVTNIHSTLRGFCSANQKNYKTISRLLAMSRKKNILIVDIKDFLVCYHSDNSAKLLNDAIVSL